MDELNTYLRIGENIVGQSKVIKSTGLYVDIRDLFHVLDMFESQSVNIIFFFHEQ